jgi:hypothetical protein
MRTLSALGSCSFGRASQGLLRKVGIQIFDTVQNASATASEAAQSSGNSVAFERSWGDPEVSGGLLLGEVWACDHLSSPSLDRVGVRPSTGRWRQTADQKKWAD